MIESCGFQVVAFHSYGPKRACLMNDFLVPFSVPELVTKRLFNRWTLFPRLRRVLLAPVLGIAGSILNGAECCDDGGLVFLAARKP